MHPGRVVTAVVCYAIMIGIPVSIFAGMYRTLNQAEIVGLCALWLGCLLVAAAMGADSESQTRY